jgi:uncharacterized protein (TIRG00374 family)
MTACAVAAETVATGRPVPTGATLRRLPWRAIAVAVFAALAATELVLAWPYVSRALTHLADPNPSWLWVAVVAELVSMRAFASVQQRMLAAGGRRVSTCRIVGLTYVANAVNATLPGGPALSAGYTFRRLRAWGASAPVAAFTLVASGLLSTTSFVLLVVACIVLAGSGAISAVPVLITVAALAVVAVLVHRHGLTDVVTRSARGVLRRYNRARHRAPDSGLDAVHRLVGDLLAIRPRPRDWLAGIGFASLNWVADLICLAACCRAVGTGGTTVALVLAAYVAGMSTSSLSVLPGGFGAVDAAMVLAFTSGGVGAVAATAGVLLYRLISLVAVVGLGWLIWTVSWFLDRSQSTRAPVTG